MTSVAGNHSSAVLPQSIQAESFQTASGAQAMTAFVWARAKASTAPNAFLSAEGISDPEFTQPTTGEVTLRYNGPNRRVQVYCYGEIQRTTGATHSTGFTMFFALARKNGAVPAAGGDVISSQQVSTPNRKLAYLNFHHSTILDLVDDDYFAPFFLSFNTVSYTLGNPINMAVQSLRRL